ncbi:uncharacterized protein [Parasteatoda tepidariorum]|uniref:uncharacterized protein n=1 Tax=Parasteatoda tepidariorum TaxID=114398 RepID=UPI00077F88D0|nr:uncharacterized protein LOC107454654 [Parasteatoda tepidariorum]XP_015927402.1 uncharacterized protein LOC107454654 [Parasteatoda tepidariorum]
METDKMEQSENVEANEEKAMFDQETTDLFLNSFKIETIKSINIEKATDSSWINHNNPRIDITEPEMLENRKIHYTRRYLLDLRYHPLSRVFPVCLKSFQDTRELPLRAPEIQQENTFTCLIAEEYYDYRNMDHILFYTSLPYRNRRLPLTRATSWNLPKLCY